MSNTRSSVRLVAEEPVGLRDDALGFTAYARTLADAAREATQPLTIGIFGEWGTGKSSLMRMVADVLREHENIVTIECNAWQYQHEPQPLFPLVVSVIRGFDDYRSGSRALGSVLEHLKQAVNAVGSEAPDEWPVTEVSAAPVDMPDRLTELLDQSQYAKAFQLLSAIEVPQGWKFVVFVDDLDRCSPERAVKLLESIKLVLAQPGFVFVLGVSRAVVEEHLEHLYREVMGVKNFSGSSYLEKLVQLPFPIPSHRDRINDLAKRLAGSLEEPELIDHLEMLASVFDYNPRALIRVVNNLIIDRSINENLLDAGTMDKVPLGMFAVSRALQHRWPSVHRLLELSAPDLAKTVVNWGTSEIPDPDKADPVLSEDEAYIAGAMRESPELASLLRSEAGVEWLTNEDGRVAAAQFVRQHKRETAPRPDEETEIFDAYISYSREDHEIASVLRSNLLDYGFNVFLDKESLSPGQRFQETKEAALRTARGLIFLCGKSSPDSTVQRQEVLAMLERQDSDEMPVIVPVILPDADKELLLERIPGVSSFKPIALSDESPPFKSATQRILGALERSRRRETSKVSGIRKIRR